MEAYILLLLFFLGLPLAIYLVLSDPSKSASSPTQTDKSAEEEHGAANVTASYAIVAALLAFFCVLTVLVQRQRS